MSSLGRPLADYRSPPIHSMVESIDKNQKQRVLHIGSWNEEQLLEKSRNTSPI